MKNFFTKNGVYSLKNSESILRQTVHHYHKQKKKLSPTQINQLEMTLTGLQKEILASNRERAHDFAKQAESLAKHHLRKSTFDHIRDLVFALAFALIVAVIVRQMWFEFYEIPSGSMRPTLKEKDRLIVSKTDFGINLPLTTKHIYFDPELVQRGSIVIFTGENMDIRDVDTLYFYLFPGKKQYIKRMIGKPGDTLYFYGGRIYGVDTAGNDISEQLQPIRLDLIDHIPFIHFEGKAITPHSPVNGIYSPVIIYQMNEPVAKLAVTSSNQPQGEMLPAAHAVSDYGNLWGFKNYAQARLLKKDQVKQMTPYGAGIADAALYLELKHNPSLSHLKLGQDEMGRLRPMMALSTSIIPLQDHHLRSLFDHLYTARFVIKNGFARRIGAEDQIGKNAFVPCLPGIPDGTYEFYYGKAYQVKWQGITVELPANHPLNRFDPDRLQLLFNVGIEFNMLFAPQSKHQTLMPSRFAYFYDSNLYVMGAPLLQKGDPTLAQFLADEEIKKSAANAQNPYVPFLDAGAPLQANGKLDIDKIKKFGITVPAKMYLVLGDNHAMSADSRDFGFVPEDNLRGGPDFIFWPTGARWGAPNQLPYPWFNFPRTLIWALAALCIGTWAVVHRKHNRLPLDI